MREVSASKIKEAVTNLCITANCDLPTDVLKELNNALNKEESLLGLKVLDDILKNAQMAADKHLPICQDTGLAIFFIDFGEEVFLRDDLQKGDNLDVSYFKLGQADRETGTFESREGILQRAVSQGVASGYKYGNLRKSVVSDPLFDRVNTSDNTPPIINLRLVPGDRIHIILVPKGGGCENKSFLRMLNPADGIDGVKRVLLEAVHAAGAGACPPFVIGIGIGGSSELAMLNAKRASMANLDSSNPDVRYAGLEEELLTLVNNSGLGPQGLGGRVTALKVNIEYAPAHIASLPVAVSISCHAARHASIIL